MRLGVCTFEPKRFSLAERGLAPPQPLHQPLQLRSYLIPGTFVVLLLSGSLFFFYNVLRSHVPRMNGRPLDDVVSCHIYRMYLSVIRFVSRTSTCCCVALAEVLMMVHFFSRCKSSSRKLLRFFGQLFQFSRDPFTTLPPFSLVKSYIPITKRECVGWRKPSSSSSYRQLYAHVVSVRDICWHDGWRRRFVL